MEQKLSSEGEALGLVDHKAARLDENIVLKGLLFYDKSAKILI